jgi:hypothetical protein
MPHELGGVGRGLDPHPYLILMLKFKIPYSTRIYSLSSDVSDRYNNLKASWDSVMKAANHGYPRSFYVAVTVVLEQLKREELKRKNAESKT